MVANTIRAGVTLFILPLLRLQILISNLWLRRSLVPFSQYMYIRMRKWIRQLSFATTLLYVLQVRYLAEQDGSSEDCGGGCAIRQATSYQRQAYRSSCRHATIGGSRASGTNDKAGGEFNLIRWLSLVQ